MRTGLAYMGHHNPKHVRQDLEEIRSLGCDDIFLAAQENDFVYMTGKPDFFPELAKEYGIRPLVIFWGALNLFGGGKSSQFLLNNPQAYQRAKDGSHIPAGCYNNPCSIEYIKGLIDLISERGFEGYFIDEPSLINCYCPSCQNLFEKIFQNSLISADASQVNEFRRKAVINYVRGIADYIKKNHAQLETQCCLMPSDKSAWAETAQIEALDNLGTDIYWVNEDKDVEGMTPLVREMAQVCQNNNKKHHQWLQAWGVQKGKEPRIIAQGEILLREQPDAVYVWAYQGQIGTSESCEDPQTAWAAACEILKKARQVT